MSKITPHSLWLAHRAAAGGRSTVSGAQLPETLDDCAVGPQETHYAMCCFIAALYEDPHIVPIPSKVNPERAEILRLDATKQAKNAAVLANVLNFLAPVS